jgi:hypothetical protein
MADLAIAAAALTDTQRLLLGVICQGLSWSFESLRRQLNLGPRDVLQVTQCSLDLHALRAAGLIEYNHFGNPIRPTSEGRAVSRAWVLLTKREQHH